MKKKRVKEILIMSFQWGLWLALLMSAFTKSPKVFLLNFKFLGISLIFLGIIFIVTANAAHGAVNKFKLKTSYMPNQKAKLVTKGIYKYIRHPIYEGFIFISFGTACVILNIMSISLAIITLIFYNFKSLYEETFLDNEYSNYSLYKKESSRFIPSIRTILK